MPDQQNRFADKVAFGTGAAGGIGRATALAFAHAGASVVVADVDVDEQANTRRWPVATDVRGGAARRAPAHDRGRLP
jgi:NAD(P)-dependent dehydrogenase (short-subunit alcohol dehydrogenase family)